MSEFNQIVESEAEYSYNFPRCQYFSLPIPIIRHITERPASSALGYKKLQQTCKYFFAKKKIIVPGKEWIGRDRLVQYASIFAEKPSEVGKIQFWLTKGFICYDEAVIFQKIMKIIYRFDIRELVINYQDITLEDLNILFSGGKIIWLSLWEVNIRDSHGKPARADVILSKVPKAINIWYGNKCEIFSSKTFEELLAIKFTEKFGRFSLDIGNITNKIHPWLVYKFIQKNFKPSSLFSLNFPPTFGENYQKYLKSICDIKECKVEVNFDA